MEGDQAVEDSQEGQLAGVLPGSSDHLSPISEDVCAADGIQTGQPRDWLQDHQAKSQPEFVQKGGASVAINTSLCSKPGVTLQTLEADIAPKLECGSRLSKACSW